MERHKWMIAAAILLTATSAAAYFVHYLIFRDPHHIFIYLVGDIAFVPVEVLLVAIVIERMLRRHDKQALMHKLNMVIGTFFSEVGTDLLGKLTDCIQNRAEIREQLAVGAEWSHADFRAALNSARQLNYQVRPDRLDLVALKQLLVAKRDFLLVLLANPNLLEHERFTDLLWAVFHLSEELIARDPLEGLPETDLAHLAGDVKRVYTLLTTEWLLYCRHLKKAYPFIFSITVRTHPLQDAPSATVAT